MIHDTCIETCRYRDKKSKYKTTCPDYIELNWTSETGETRITHDCARRRSVLLMMNWDQRLIGVQQATENERNSCHALFQKIGEMISVVSSKNRQELLDKKQSENQSPLIIRCEP